MITLDGWFDWAIRHPGPNRKVNGWDNPVLGFTAHSAEGWKQGMLDILNAKGNSKSWHLSNFMDGTVLQHYPIDARCWHCGNQYGNDNYLAMESEGTLDGPLNYEQEQNVIRVFNDLKEYKGFIPVREITVFEHSELTNTDCPSDRYDWEVILASFQDSGIELPTNEQVSHASNFFYTGFWKRNKQEMQGSDLDAIQRVVDWYRSP